MRPRSTASSRSRAPRSPPRPRPCSSTTGWAARTSSRTRMGAARHRDSNLDPAWLHTGRPVLAARAARVRLRLQLSYPSTVPPPSAQASRSSSRVTRSRVRSTTRSASARSSPRSRARAACSASASARAPSTSARATPIPIPHPHPNSNPNHNPRCAAWLLDSSERSKGFSRVPPTAQASPSTLALALER